MPPLAPLTVPVVLKDVEAELRRQTKLLHGPARSRCIGARMANLVIFCSSQSQADAVNAQLTEIMNVHPARVILLIADPKGTTGTSRRRSRCAPSAWGGRISVSASR